jgi:hypothetical protein
MIYGTPHFMIHVTDILCMLLAGKKLKELEIAILPMKTPEFNTLEPMAAG